MLPMQASNGGADLRGESKSMLPMQASNGGADLRWANAPAHLKSIPMVELLLSLFLNVCVMLCKRCMCVVFRRFQDAKGYADELEKIFKCLLELRVVSHCVCDVGSVDMFSHFFSLQKRTESLKAIYKIHANYGRVFRCVLLCGLFVCSMP